MLVQASSFELVRTLDDPTGSGLDAFGRSAEADEDRVLVGSPFDNPGQAHLFDSWTGNLLHTFDDPTNTDRDWFGYSVALDSNFVLIGAPHDDTKGNHSGQAHLFDASTGSLIRTFNAPFPSVTSNFGHSLAINGNLALIGEPANSRHGFAVGQAHLFDLLTGNLIRTFSDPSSTTQDQFGESVDIEGSYVLIGAPGDDTRALNAGQGYLFDVFTGVLLNTFDDPNASSDGNFGSTAVINGSRVLIAAPYSANKFGQTYLFEASTGSLTQTFDNPSTTGIVNDGFGASLAMAGNHILVGAPNNDTNGLSAGSAYLFDADSGGLLQTFDGGLVRPGIRVGSSVAINNMNVFIGASGGFTGVHQYALVIPEPGSMATLSMAALILQLFRGWGNSCK